MPRKRNNPVSLSREDRGKLEGLIAGGHAPARQLTHARILLKADEGEDAPNVLERLEIHYTPKHGSWLNMAEIELSVLAGQCLDRRIPDLATLERVTTAYADRRNAARATIHW